MKMPYAAGGVVCILSHGVHHYETTRKLTRRVVRLGMDQKAPWIPRRHNRMNRPSADIPRLFYHPHQSDIVFQFFKNRGPIHGLIQNVKDFTHLTSACRVCQLKSLTICCDLLRWLQPCVQHFVW
jgi:hypothetical protein